jgi:ABC-type bacteriocin/lantibiotic exporter with double-glycine peptidase domain
MISELKKINFLITKRQRKGLVILTFLLFIGMIFEAFGLGILIPALSILLDPEVIDKTPSISFFKDFFPNLSNQNFLFFFLGIIVVIYFVKTLFLVFLSFKQNRFLFNISAYISNELFSKYLNQTYSFHLKRNASELIKNLQLEAGNLNAFLISIINMFIEGGFVFAVLATLVYIEPLGAISIGIFYGLLSILFFQFTKNKLQKWGEHRKEIDSKVYKLAMEGLGGIKDLLILGKTSYFNNNYSEKNYLKARLNANLGIVSQLPRFYLELVSILGLISFIILLVLQGKDSTSLISVIGVFVAATFRVIPSLNRIIAATQSMKYYKPAVKIIYDEIKNTSQDIKLYSASENFNFQSSIKLKDVGFNFEKGKQVLDCINLEIKKGQTIGIIGESGSGKSTLIDIIIGLHKPTSGNIIIDEKIDFQLNQSFRNIIGYVSQSIYLTDDSIKNNIALGISEDMINDQIIKELLTQVQLDSFIDNLDFGINTRVGERGVQLSGGQRQRIGIARALYHNPDILVLDEATSALDTETESEVMRSVTKLKGKKTIIIVTHRTSTLLDADVIYKIENKNLNIFQ